MLYKECKLHIKTKPVQWMCNKLISIPSTSFSHNLQAHSLAMRRYHFHGVRFCKLPILDHELFVFLSPPTEVVGRLKKKSRIDKQ